MTRETRRIISFSIRQPISGTTVVVGAESNRREENLTVVQPARKKSGCWTGENQRRLPLHKGGKAPKDGFCLVLRAYFGIRGNSEKAVRFSGDEQERNVGYLGFGRKRPSIRNSTQRSRGEKSPVYTSFLTIQDGLTRYWNRGQTLQIQKEAMGADASDFSHPHERVGRFKNP